MNHVLVSNWNNTVKAKNTVYFLGDMSFGRGNRRIDYWLDNLNGKIVCIKGNHDKSKSVKFHQSFVLQYKSHKFLLIHNPVHAPKWNDWIIHGHIHNNDLENYPFINRKKRTINVSAEVINYKPLDLEFLFNINFENIDRIEIISD